MLAHTFNRMLERLEASFESLHRFTADASHELRAPLSVIRSQVEVALSRRREPAEYERVLKSVLTQVEHLTEISGRLLLIARADAGALKPKLEPVDMPDFMRESGARWRPLVESRRSSLEVNAPEAGESHADRTLFRPVVDKLPTMPSVTQRGSQPCGYHPGGPVRIG